MKHFYTVAFFSTHFFIFQHFHIFHISTFFFIFLPQKRLYCLPFLLLYETQNMASILIPKTWQFLFPSLNYFNYLSRKCYQVGAFSLHHYVIPVFGGWKMIEFRTNCIFARIMTLHVAKQQVRIIRCHHECDTIRTIPWPAFFLPSALPSQNPFLHVIQAVNCFLQPLRKLWEATLTIFQTVPLKQSNTIIPYVWNLKTMIQMNIFTQQKQTDLRNLWFYQG